MFNKRGRRAWGARVVAVAALGLVTAACGSSGGGDDDTIELRFASYLDKTDANSMAVEAWMEEITERTDGKVTFKSYYNESLVPAAEALSAAAAGRVDIAFSGSFYHTAEWPLTTIASLPMITENGPAQSYALYNLYLENEDYKAEWNNSGVHLLWPGPLGEAIIGTKEPISSPRDLDGVSVRAAGLSAEFLAQLGVNPVTVPSPEIYESLDRGLISAYASIPMNQVPMYGLDEVSTNVYGGWYGSYANGPIIMNLKTYEGLDDDIREVIDEVTAKGVRMSTDFIKEAEVEACTSLKESGVTVESFPESVKADLEPLAKPYVEKWIADQEAEGRPGQAFFDAYMDALAAAETEFSDYSAATKACAAS